jgi:hypothetical protein
MIGPGTGEGHIKSIGFRIAVGRGSGNDLCGGSETLPGSFQEGLFFGVSVFGVGETIDETGNVRTLQYGTEHDERSGRKMRIDDSCD